jgi:hypothetical protein
MALTKVSSALFEGDSPTFTELATLTGTTPQLDFKQTSGAHILASVRAEVDSGTGGKLVISTKRDGDAAVDRLTIDDDGASTFSGSVTATSLDISGNIDVDGVTNLDVVDIDGAVDMASTLTMSAGGTISAGGLNDLVLNAGASGTPDIYLQSASSTKVKIEGSTGAATFSDDITLGGTTHRVWGSGYNTVQLDTSAMLYGNASSISTASNLYYNSGWKHVATGAIGINVNEAGYHTFYTGPSGSAGAAASFNQRLSINPAGNITINEDGVDADFRVESNEHTHALFVDGGNNTVGIDQSSPTYLLDVGNSSSAPANGNVMRINSNGDTIFSLSKAGTSLFSMRNNANSYTALSSNSGADLLLGHSASGAGAIVDHLRFRATSTVFNEDGVDRDFRVESDALTHALFIEGNTSNVYMGSSANIEGGRVQVTSAKTLTANIPYGMLGVNDNTAMAQGVGGAINFCGMYHSNGSITSLGSVEGYKTLSNNGNYDGTLVLKARAHGGNQIDKLRLNSTEAVFNEDGVDTDFRVASDNHTHALFVDGANGNFMVGATSIADVNSIVTSHLIAGASSTAGGGAVGVYNNTGTANCPAFNVLNRDASTDTTNRFMQFYANVTSSTATAMGGIVGNGASNVQFAALSDVREKQNIEAITNSLNKITSLNPVEFDWITSGEHCKAGFIAQEVEEVFPEFVVENMASEGQEERKGLTGGMTGGIVAHLVKAIQEQQTLIETLTARITALENA